MYSNINHIANLQIISSALQEINDDVIYVGASVAELYANNPELSEIRPTYDVDCIIELSSYHKYSILEDKLRRKGFKHDLSSSSVICRWIFQGVIVDIMPTDEKILGFSNKWYIEGAKTKQKRELPNGNIIHILSPQFYLASKLEAHLSRGGNDLRQSHDFEDIIYILENCSLLTDNITNNSVKVFLQNEFSKLLQNNNLEEAVESALSYGAGIKRVSNVLNIMKKLIL
jgi:predicted nucleotidyltransferase